MDFNQQKRDIKEIFQRLKYRNFSGNMGLAIKNNFFQTIAALTKKFGSLIFTIILARILMPELFGLYSLALSTIVLFSLFSNMGIDQALIKYVSREFGKGREGKAKAYSIYFGKIKFFLVTISIIFLIFSSKFISQTYYQKPLFLALIAGAFYILFLRVSSFMILILQAKNYFKSMWHKEIIFQISRLIFVPLASFLALKYNLYSEQVVFIIILFLSLSHLISAIFVNLIVNKKTNFSKIKQSYLTKEQKKDSNKFLISLSAIVLSGLFFSQIDMIMLGHFVDSIYIGFYKASLSLITAFFSIIGFSSALLPIFSRLSKKRVTKAFKKTTKLTFLISLPIIGIIILFAPLIIKIVYGLDYLPSVNILRIFSLLLIVIPLIDTYKTFFISIGKPKFLAKLLFLSTLLNIALNYFFIKFLLPFGQIFAVFGVTIVTLLTNYLMLLGLFLYQRKTKLK